MLPRWQYALNHGPRSLGIEIEMAISSYVQGYDSDSSGKSINPLFHLKWIYKPLPSKMTGHNRREFAVRTHRPLVQALTKLSMMEIWWVDQSVLYKTGKRSMKKVQGILIKLLYLLFVWKGIGADPRTMDGQCRKLWLFWSRKNSFALTSSPVSPKVHLLM